VRVVQNNQLILKDLQTVVIQCLDQSQPLEVVVADLGIIMQDAQADQAVVAVQDQLEPDQILIPVQMTVEIKILAEEDL
jgi:hypothetical protein